MKQNMKFGIGAVLAAMLLMSMAFAGAADSSKDFSEDSSERALSGYDVFQIERIEIPDFGPGTFENVKKKYNVLDTKGKIPRYETQTERQMWLGKLHENMDDVRGDMGPYLHPNGPMIRYGWDINGYFEVIFYENATVTKSQIDEIYAIINKKAKQKGVQDIPVVFMTDDFIQECISDYDDYCRPVIGAIQVQTVKDGTTYAATLGFAAKKSDGTKGYVLAKHFANAVGLEVYQPTVSPSYSINQVTELGGHNADASFVEYYNVEPKIFLDAGGTGYVRGYIDDIPQTSWVGWRVYKSGKTTGVTGGYITGVDVTTNQDGYLYYHQVKADYESLGGDSGAPVYVLDGVCKIIGLHHGRSVDGTTSYFSPVSGIVTDLGVTPLTY